jgi:SpoVK/Ycf46/Vps4 family AAA+-type ATPase
LQKRTTAYKLPPTPSSILEYLVEKTAGYSGAELDKLVREAIYLAEYGHLPTKIHWENALLQISPQYRTSNMHQLLRKYLKLIEGGGGKPASELEIGFLENLILGS